MKKIVVIVCLLLFAGNAYSKEGGNGAGGWLCPGGKVEIADLYEASLKNNFTENGLSIERDFTTPINKQVKLAINKIYQMNQKFGEDVEQAYSEAQKAATPSDGPLEFPHDMLNIFRKEDCEPVGIGLYEDESPYNAKPARLFIDYDILSNKMLSPTDVAAFWLHEAIYLALRKAYRTIPNSKYVRKLVGYLFSTEAVENYPHDANPFSIEIKKDSISTGDHWETHLLYLDHFVYREYTELKIEVISNDPACNAPVNWVAENPNDDFPKTAQMNKPFAVPVITNKSNLLGQFYSDNWGIEFSPNLFRLYNLPPNYQCSYEYNIYDNEMGLIKSGSLHYHLRGAAEHLKNALWSIGTVEIYIFSDAPWSSQN